MGVKMLINDKLVTSDLVADDCYDAISQLGSLLVSEGCTGEEYTDGVLDRERNYPTGIAFPTLSVALPHGEPDCVKRPAIAIGRCHTPVRFRQMEDFDQSIEVQLVALLAVSDPDAHLEVLSKLIEAFADESFCAQVMAASTPGDVAALFNDAINVSEAI